MYRLINRKEIRKFRKMRFWRRRLGDMTKPRLCVFRSNKHIQAQIIDDVKGIVLASASSIEASLKLTALKGKNMAAKIGELIAQRAQNNGISTVVFDRNGFKYHGRIQELADTARKFGLKF